MKIYLSQLITYCGGLDIPGFAVSCSDGFHPLPGDRMYFDAGRYQGKVSFEGNQVVELDADGYFQMSFVYRKRTITRRVQARTMLRDPDQSIEEFLLIKQGLLELLPWLPEDQSFGSAGWRRMLSERRREQRLADQCDTDAVLAMYD